jgi:hypothetical protein
MIRQPLPRLLGRELVLGEPNRLQFGRAFLRHAEDGINAWAGGVFVRKWHC